MSWLPKEERHCIGCGKKGVVERRRCKDCAKEYNRLRAEKRYKKHGRHNYGSSTCPICGKPMTLWRKDQAAHLSCRRKVVSNYCIVPRSSKGNTVGRQVVLDLGIDIPEGWVVHHLDEDPWNNEDYSNLILLSRSDHNSLHRYLQHHWSLFLKENSSNPEDCWKVLRDQLTTAWFEKTGAKCLKIVDMLDNQQPSS